MPQAQVYSEMLNLLKPKGILMKEALVREEGTEMAMEIVKTNFCLSSFIYCHDLNIMEYEALSVSLFVTNYTENVL